MAWPLERGQAFNDRHHFHPVVGGVQLAAKQLLNMLARLEPNPPPPRAGVAIAGTIGVNFNGGQMQSFSVKGRLTRLSERATGAVATAVDRTVRQALDGKSRPAGTRLVANKR